MDYAFILFIVFALALGLLAQFLINWQYSKYMKVPTSTGLTGAQSAFRMLEASGLGHIQIQMIGGKLTDNFNPKTGVISLSTDVYNGYSVAATAIACHETGHAIQHATAYAPVKIRTALFPVVNIASNLWYLTLIIGIYLEMIELYWLAIIMYALVLVFQLVTLPVELNASARATAFITGVGYLPEDERRGANRVLNAAAMTYVAAALASFAQLIRLISSSRRR
jgi:Zn-dependent membrane protease YugP